MDATPEESWLLTVAARSRIRAEHPCVARPRIKVCIAQLIKGENMSITAKARVTGKTPNTDGQTNLNFGANYVSGLNQEWAKYTPILNITMVVLDSVAENFEVGQAFTLTFTPEVSS